jgi:transcriptional antiterminator NusG
LEQQTEPPGEQITKQALEIAPEQEGTRYFSIGESVRVLDGPWAGQTGTITDIDVDQRRVTVLVSFFGRETPVVLHFKQVESI